IALDHYYGSAIPRAELTAALHELRTAIDRSIKARETKRESLEKSLKEAYRAEEYRRIGELLLANAHRIEPGSESVVLEDYYEVVAADKKIELDPLKSVPENAEVYFRRYRKSKDSAAAHSEFMEQVKAELMRLRESREESEQADSVARVTA